MDDALESISAEAAGSSARSSAIGRSSAARTGLSWQRVKTIEANGFRARSHVRTGTKAARTVLTGHSGLVDDLLRRDVAYPQESCP